MAPRTSFFVFSILIFSMGNVGCEYDCLFGIFGQMYVSSLKNEVCLVTMDTTEQTA